MSAIFGIFHRDGTPVEHSHLGGMRGAMTEWRANGGDLLFEGPAALGLMRSLSAPEAKGERLPWYDKARGLMFTAAGRVDNRDELAGIRQNDLSDAEIIFQAYLTWGQDCPVRIHGDWAFALWDARQRRLFLARDHHGNTSLYYYADSRIFAFSSSRKALLALGLAPVAMDELYLAQVLVSWPGYHGERTIHVPIKRLPPAHCLTVSSDKFHIRRFWRLEDTQEIRLAQRGDYVEAFKEIFDEAVRCRLRADSPVAVSLSGGLDSGSVAATAAAWLKEKNSRLIGLTSVPQSDTNCYVGKSFGDELPFAQILSAHAQNIELHAISAATISPIQAIRQVLHITNEPSHSAVNLFWMLAIRKAAQSLGCTALLTGQSGNPGISWTGSIFSQPLHFQVRHFGLRKWPKKVAQQYAPPALLKAYRNLRIPRELWWKSSAINPDFAQRLKLRERLLSAPDSLLSPALRKHRGARLFMIKPGRQSTSMLEAEIGAAYGLEIRDPTADARVLSYTLSVPDHIFIDPQTGMDRWLIREAMQGRLPDEVRLNRRRGRQAGDLVPRLRACASEVETALDELAQGPAAAYVDVPYMRDVWRMVQINDTREAFRKSTTILTRGIMAGLWVNGFYNAS